MRVRGRSVPLSSAGRCERSPRDHLDCTETVPPQAFVARGKGLVMMGHYLVFQRSAQDRKALKDSGYPWAALVFAPLWAFSKGLTLHGVVLVVLYGACAVLMGVATNGIIVGVAIALWLGVFTAHNATDWLTSSYEKRGYRMTGGIEAASAKEALHAYRKPKGHRVLLENASLAQLGEMLTVTRSKTVA